MRTIYDSKFKRDVTLIVQGEVAISSQGKMLSTTLGSCIAVCLFDPEACVGGMNHYMLPAPALKEDSIHFAKAKYGVNSMELLINEILKAGGARERLKAKVFGGANMFTTSIPSSKLLSVGAQNISFAQSYLSVEKIPLLAQDVGGDHARKVYFDSSNGKVKLFRLRSTKASEIIGEEVKYRENLIKEDQKRDEESIDDKLTLF